MQRTIRQLAVIDELTGLYNRRGFNTLNLDVIENVKRSEERGFLCYFDLDHFKQINDEFGHAKGDEALVEFSGLLRKFFRKDVLLVRLGGDEFVAMGTEPLVGQTEETLRAIEIVLSLRNARGTSGFSLEASAGVTYFDKEGPFSMEELGALADAELYRNKDTRRRARTGARSKTVDGATATGEQLARNILDRAALAVSASRPPIPMSVQETRSPFPRELGASFAGERPVKPGVEIALRLRLACEANDPSIIAHLDQVSRYGLRDRSLAGFARGSTFRPALRHAPA